MDAKSNLSFNGGSGGLVGSSQNIFLGAGGLKAPAYQHERLQVLRKIFFVVVVLAAVNTVVVEGNPNL